MDHNCVVKVISELIALGVQPDDILAKIMISFFYWSLWKLVTNSEAVLALVVLHPAVPAGPGPAAPAPQAPTSHRNTEPMSVRRWTVWAAQGRRITPKGAAAHSSRITRGFRGPWRCTSIHAKPEPRVLCWKAQWFQTWIFMEWKCFCLLL